MKGLDIDYTVLRAFRLGVCSSKDDMDNLLNKQKQLGLRKKAENWVIFLSNYLHDTCGFESCIKNNGNGYRYLEMKLTSPLHHTVVICHIIYLKDRTLFPRSAIYRDLQRRKNPSIQHEFADTSFFQKAQEEVYYIFGFGEDKKGLFGIFYQPDSLLPCYYAQSENCFTIPAQRLESETALTEQPDLSVFTIKNTLLEKMTGMHA